MVRFRRSCCRAPVRSGLFILALLGVALYVICSLIEGRVTGWAVRSDNFATGG
jgi:NitT/TauT family transport system permease protein